MDLKTEKLSWIVQMDPVQSQEPLKAQGFLHLENQRTDVAEGAGRRGGGGDPRSPGARDPRAGLKGKRQRGEDRGCSGFERLLADSQAVKGGSQCRGF